MNLIESFEGKNHGLGAYAALRKRCEEAIRPGASENALNRILISIIDDFTETFDHEPLTSIVARDAYHEMVLILKRAAIYETQAAPEKLAVLNEIASRHLHFKPD